MAMPLKREIPRTAALPAEPGDKTQRPKSSSHLSARYPRPRARARGRRKTTGDAVVSALRKRRIEAGYPTLEAIAKATGISYGRISQFERGYWRLGPAYLEAYARALRCSTEDVLRDQPAWDIAPLGGTSYRRKGYKRRIALPPEFIERAKKVLVDFDQSLEDWLVEIGNEKLDEIEGVE